jgi:Flp pilus assembly protein protease CpaA
VNVALLLLAIPICIADMHSLVIPNIYTKLLAYITLMHLAIFGFDRLSNVVTSSAVLVFLVVFGIGMGDIKLLGLILITHPYSAIEFVGSILVLAMVHIVVLIAFRRGIPSKIPLAPSIFVGFLSYLATR